MYWMCSAIIGRGLSKSLLELFLLAARLKELWNYPHAKRWIDLIREVGGPEPEQELQASVGFCRCLSFNAGVFFRGTSSRWSCCRVPLKMQQAPHQHLVHEADDSPCTRELERRLSTHSEDLQEELSRHQQVQVDLGRAEGVGLSLCNKWPRGETATKFPSMGGLNFNFRQKRHKLRSYQSIHL